MSYQLQQTSQFKKDCKRMKKRGANMKELTDVIALLQSGQALPPENVIYNRTCFSRKE